MNIALVTAAVDTADVLRRVLGLRPDFQITWAAATGIEAAALCLSHRPDLVLLDLSASGNHGIEATRQIMAAAPCAILLLAPSILVRAGAVCEAISKGALDAVNIPLVDGDLQVAAAPLLAKIAVLSRLMALTTSPVPIRTGVRTAPGRASRLIAIGASTGGPAVLASLLHQLPPDLAAAVVIVQHVDRHFAAGMADWLNHVSGIPVRIANEGDHPSLGEALLAGTSDHLAMKAVDRLGYVVEPADYVYRPSVDVFFESVCRLWPGEVIGVLLTGMGRDGAIGLKALRDKGHHTIAQDEATSAVYGMPKAAAQLAAAVEILPVDLIAPRLIELVYRRKAGTLSGRRPVRSTAS